MAQEAAAGAGGELQCYSALPTSFLHAAPNVVAEWGGGGTLLKSITVVKLRASLVSL